MPSIDNVKPISSKPVHTMNRWTLCAFATNFVDNRFLRKSRIDRFLAYPFDFFNLFTFPKNDLFYLCKNRFTI